VSALILSGMIKADTTAPLQFQNNSIRADTTVGPYNFEISSIILG
jgi:hypothetical protein